VPVAVIIAVTPANHTKSIRFSLAETSISKQENALGIFYKNTLSTNITHPCFLYPYAINWIAINGEHDEQ
jgi:hypothetical protein